MVTFENLKTNHLSQREEECAAYILKGYSAKEIGKVLGVSHRTIEGHLSNLKRKMQCNKTASLVVKLIALEPNLQPLTHFP